MPLLTGVVAASPPLSATSLPPRRSQLPAPSQPACLAAAAASRFVASGNGEYLFVVYYPLSQPPLTPASRLVKFSFPRRHSQEPPASLLATTVSIVLLCLNFIAPTRPSLTSASLHIQLPARPQPGDSCVVAGSNGERLFVVFYITFLPLCLTFLCFFLICCFNRVCGANVRFDWKWQRRKWVCCLKITFRNHFFIAFTKF